MQIITLPLFALLGAVWVMIAGPWYLSLALYLAGGLIWVAQEKQRPPLHRSMAYMSAGGTILLLVFWPVRATVDLRETWKLRRSSERFVVVGDSEIAKFPRFDDAVSAAKVEATATGQRVMVSDRARFAKQLGRVQHKSWFVEADGSVNLLPRS